MAAAAAREAEEEKAAAKAQAAAAAKAEAEADIGDGLGNPFKQVGGVSAVLLALGLSVWRRGCCSLQVSTEHSSAPDVPLAHHTRPPHPWLQGLKDPFSD